MAQILSFQDGQVVASGLYDEPRGEAVDALILEIALAHGLIHAHQTWRTPSGHGLFLEPGDCMIRMHGGQVIECAWGDEQIVPMGKGDVALRIGTSGAVYLDVIRYFGEIHGW